MGSAALAAAAFIAGVMVGWLVRPRGREVGDSRNEAAASVAVSLVAPLPAGEGGRDRAQRGRGRVRGEQSNESRSAAIPPPQAIAEDIVSSAAAAADITTYPAEIAASEAATFVPPLGVPPPPVEAAVPAAKRRERETTVLVCDVGSVAGDDAVPANVLRCLTDLQKVLSGIIGDEGGAIDRFAGERLIAVFAAKRKSTDHAGRALEAAERIANNVGALSRRLQYDLRIGIGIHTGSLPLGDDGHVDSSAIGDAIDVASRLEALASEAKVSVVLTGAVLEHAEREEEAFEMLGEMPLGGDDQLTRIFTPRPRDGAVQLDLIDIRALRA